MSWTDKKNVKEKKKVGGGGKRWRETWIGGGYKDCYVDHSPSHPAKNHQLPFLSQKIMASWWTSWTRMIHCSSVKCVFFFFFSLFLTTWILYSSAHSISASLYQCLYIYLSVYLYLNVYLWHIHCVFLGWCSRNFFRDTRGPMASEGVRTTMPEITSSSVFPLIFSM